MQKIKLFDKEMQIGGYSLPTDFVYIDKNTLIDICGLTFTEKYKKIYKLITNISLTQDKFINLSGCENCGTICSLDDYIAVIELNDGENADYSDYIIDKTNLLTCIYSGVTLFAVIYSDLYECGIVSNKEPFNISINGNDGLMLLCSYLAKKCGVPINNILVCSNKIIDETINNIYFTSVGEEDIECACIDFFEDFEYPIDIESCYSVVAEENYHYDYEKDDTFTLIFNTSSPYFFARKILSCLFGKNEISVEKAIKLLNLETALEIPECIKSGKIKPFYKKYEFIDINSCLLIIKSVI